MNAIEIKNLNFNYKDVSVFNDFNLSIDKNSFTTILSKNSFGKSTLFKILSGGLNFQGDVLLFNKSINYNLDKKYLGLVSPNLYEFKEKTVTGLLSRELLDSGKTIDKLENAIKRLAKKYELNDILDSKIRDLNIKERVLLMFIIQIINKPKILIIDNSFDYLDTEKEKIVNELKKLNKKNTTIVNITNNTEECLYGKEIVILDKTIQKFNVNEITEDDFLNHNLEVPFIISLSSKLKFYNLIENNYLNMEKLVDDLWQ